MAGCRSLGAMHSFRRVLRSRTSSTSHRQGPGLLDSVVDSASSGSIEQGEVRVTDVVHLPGIQRFMMRVAVIAAE